MMREETLLFLFLKDHKTESFSGGRVEGRRALCQSC